MISNSGYGRITLSLAFEPNGILSMKFRLIATYVFTGLLGLAFAYFVAFLVGLKWPNAKAAVFLIISLWWLWTGWRYAKARDRGRIS